jgi:hypothetical protein
MLDETVQSIEETMTSHCFQEGASTENFLDPELQHEGADSAFECCCDNVEEGQ